jgi:hypothetical protein
VAQVVMIDRILMATSDRHHARRDDFYHLVTDAALITPLDDPVNEEPAPAALTLCFTRKQKTRARG